MTDNEVLEALIKWLSGQTGLRAIKAHQGGERPDKPYLMVNLLSDREVRDHPQETETTETQALNSAGNPEVKVAPVIEMEWAFSVHAYGENPTDTLRPLKSRAHVAQSMEPLFPGLTVHEFGIVNNVPAWVNNAWEPRAQANVFVRGLTRDSAIVDVIDKATADISAV